MNKAVSIWLTFRIIELTTAHHSVFDIRLRLVLVILYISHYSIIMLTYIVNIIKVFILLINL